MHVWAEWLLEGLRIWTGWTKPSSSLNSPSPSYPSGDDDKNWWWPPKGLGGGHEPKRRKEVYPEPWICPLSPSPVWINGSYLVQTQWWGPMGILITNSSNSENKWGVHGGVGRRGSSPRRILKTRPGMEIFTPYFFFNVTKTEAEQDPGTWERLEQEAVKDRMSYYFKCKS